MRINYNVQAMNANLALNKADSRVSKAIGRLSSGLKIAAAKAIAGVIKDDELTADYIIPKAFDPRVKDAVAAAVAQAARDTGVARI